MICDTAYVLLLDRWERQTLADRQAHLTITHSYEDLPSLAATVLDFNAALLAEPDALDDSEMAQLRCTLGV